MQGTGRHPLRLYLRIGVRNLFHMVCVLRCDLESDCLMVLVIYPFGGCFVTRFGGVLFAVKA